MRKLSKILLSVAGLVVCFNESGACYQATSVEYWDIQKDAEMRNRSFSDYQPVWANHTVVVVEKEHKLRDVLAGVAAVGIVTGAVAGGIVYFDEIAACSKQLATWGAGFFKKLMVKIPKISKNVWYGFRKGSAKLLGAAAEVIRPVTQPVAQPIANSNITVSAASSNMPSSKRLGQPLQQHSEQQLGSSLEKMYANSVSSPAKAKQLSRRSGQKTVAPIRKAQLDQRANICRMMNETMQSNK